MTLNEPIRVAIVDDDPSFRQTVCRWLEGVEGVEIVGEMAGGPEVLHRLREVQPEVLLLDVAALSVEQIRAAAAWARIIVLHVPEQEPLVLEALRAGALGHLDKTNAHPSRASAAVRAASRGAAFLSPAMAGRVLDEVSARQRRGHERR